MKEIKFKDAITLPNKLSLFAIDKEIPEYITSNLRYKLFKWQEEALKNFLAYQDKKDKLSNEEYTHLMFNLATGAGKTLLMASSILYYYKQGYRNFLFLVNQNNIVNKTEHNLANKYHPKYLFSQDIVIDGKQIEIRKVDNFSDGQDGVIEIKFCTINKFYNDIHIDKENTNTLEDLRKKNIVMLADEAHHLNANSKKYEDELLDKAEKLKGNAGADKIEKLGWEDTVINLVLQKGVRDTEKNICDTENKNVLLEFTATIPNNLNVAEKYKDKTIFCFDLKDFLSKGYTKQINLLSSQSDKKNRILIALLFNWYRHKIALDNDIRDFKSVILFRSKSIDESKKDFEDFKSLIHNLKPEDIENLKQESNINKSDNKLIYEQANDRFAQILQYITKKNIESQGIVNFIQENFEEKNLIITNSKSGTKKEQTVDEQESLLNNLEQKNNLIRAIFTVDRLTEGWDVLNLFDIVRLYKGQNTGGSNKKTSSTTTKEKQLIGRGVRYYPFQYQEKEPSKRKFDNDLKNELRVLEELFYHTYDEESRYISHLKTELKKDGYITDNKEVVEFDLKEVFKNTDFYKDVKILRNKKIPNPKKIKNTLDSIKKDKEDTFKYNLTKGITQESWDSKNSNIPNDVTQERIKLNKIIDRHILRKALSKSKNLDFTRLNNELEIQNIEDLLKDEFFGDIYIGLILSKSLESINNQEKLNIAINFLDWFDKKIKKYSRPYIGTKEFEALHFSKIFAEPKRKMIDKNEFAKIESYQDSWYILNKCYINKEERKCLEDIATNLINKIKDKKKIKIYLLRNEEVYKIFNFKDGQGFQPDFIIFIKDKDNCYYQILAEVKGNHLIEHDTWKKGLLSELEKLNDGRKFELENKSYKLIGLPFYSENITNNFKEKINEIKCNITNN